MDKNSDGFISREEVREALLEHNLSDMEVENVLAKVGLEDAVNFNKLSELITPYWDNVVPTRDHVEAVFKLVSLHSESESGNIYCIHDILRTHCLAIKQLCTYYHLHSCMNTHTHIHIIHFRKLVVISLLLQNFLLWPTY